MYLYDLRTDKPPFLKSQTESLAWLASAYAQSALPQATSDETPEKRLADFTKLLGRVGCQAPHIESRAHYSPVFQGTGDAELFPKEQPGSPGAGTNARMQVYARESGRIVDDLFAPTTSAPGQLLHVTCTGYLSPSPAERFVLAKEWTKKTTVSHVYHMGCYASIPALHLAQALANLKPERVDIVHTELCSLHLQTFQPTLEQMVIQSLFADGGALYSVQAQKPKSTSFRILGLKQELVPGTAELMTWKIGEHGMDMTLSKEVPKAISSQLRDFQLSWFKEMGLSLVDVQKRMYYAIHPGGPRIIDQVKETLEISEDRLGHSRDVLRTRGNMSSATLPHVWQRLMEDDGIPVGSLILSYAFGPGLTVAASLFEKCEASG